MPLDHDHTPVTVDGKRAVVDAFGGVDVLVYSPSHIARKGVLDVTDEEWAAVFDVQLTGAYRATQLFARAMDAGAILHIASASAETAIPDLAAYSAAKGGLDAFVRVAADELGPEIRVNAIRPGFVRSEQTEGTYTEGTPRFETIRERTTGEIVTVDDGFVAATFEA